MANQTLSVTSRNLDNSAIAGLLNGEDISIDGGAVLTIDSDNRWSQQSAVIGNITISATSGGQVLVDGTKVWWMPFDAPTGNVPVLGTEGVQNCTGQTSLATGEFLGIWASMGTAPLASGGAIPSTGFIKFRSKVGDFLDNEIIDLPGGATITVNSATGGQRGWIHLVGEQSTTITVPRLGKFQCTGDWFELGVTNGADDQTFPIPVMDHIPAIQIETAVGSGEYEWWLNAGRRWGTTTQYVPTDLRGKFFGQWNSGAGANTTSVSVLGSYTGLSTTSGSAVITGFTDTSALTVGQPIQMSLGFPDSTALYIVSIVPNTSITVNVNSNNTAGGRTMDCIERNITIARRVSRSCGYKPISGLRVRMPNIIISTAGATPNFAGNVLLGTVANRWDFTTTSAGDIDLDKVCSNIYLSFASPFAVSITESCTQDVLISNTGSSTVIDDVAMAPDGLRGATIFAGSNLFSGITLNKVKMLRMLDGNGLTVMTLTDVDGAEITDCEFLMFASTTATTRSNATAHTCILTRVSNSNFTRHSMIGGRTTLLQSQNIVLSDTRFADLMGNTTQTTNPLTGAIDVSATCINILVEGFSNYQGIANVHPYAVILIATAGCLDIKMRNIGTSASPYNCGSANQLGLAFSASVTKDVEIKRVYLVNTRTSPLSLANTVQDIVIDNVWGDGADSQAIAGVNCLIRGARWTNSVTGQTSVYGRHWEDAFTSTTAGRLLIAMNEPLTATLDQVTVTAGTPKFTSAGTVNMPTLGDQIVWEMPYFAIGHTALANIAPTITGTNTANFTFEYQIDLGTGYNGSWLALTGANLSSHTIPAFVNLYNQGGFKMKVRATVAVANITNALTYIRIDTVTTATEYQRQYPFYVPLVGYTGTLSGSNMAIYVDSTNDLAGTAVYDSGNNLTETPWDTNYSAILRLRKPGYEPVENTITVDEDGILVPTEQVDYTTIADTDPGALGITVTNHGASPVTWNSKDFSITITTTNDSLTASQIANYINYNISQFATFNGFSGLAWSEMVIPDGTDFQTERGRLIGSLGATLKGVRVVRNDGTTPVPGFTQFQSDDGTYYIPPVSITVAVSGLRAGSRVQIYDTTNNTEKFNAIVGGTSMSYSESYAYDYNVRIRVMYATGSTADQFIEFTDTVTVSGLARSVTPVVDSVYVANAVDGFTVTGIAIDDTALLIEADDGTYSWASIYAYETAWLFSEEGIRDEGRFITAIDNANYLLENFMIKNVSSPTAPLILTGGWGRDSITNQTIDIIDTTGGSIFSNPDLVISYATGSGLSPSEQATLSKLDTLTEDSGGLRFTTKALETAGGGSLTLGDIADAVWDELLSGHTTTGSAGDVLANAGSGGYDDTILIGKIDVIDSNVDSIKAKTDTLVNTDLTGIATSANVTSAQSAIITEVNANETKIDTLQTSVNTKPSLANIEASTVLAKEATVASIPTNPLLTNDSRLNNLDATISSRLATSGYTAPPTVGNIRTELSTELARIDVAISTRLASGSYSSPPSASTIATQVRTELTTELGRIDTTISSRLASASYTASPSASDVANAVWTAVSRTLTGDVTLDSSQITAIAVAVESAIIDEGDGQMVIDAIVQAIGNENITASTIASAVRTELATELARIDASVTSRASQTSVDGKPTLLQIEGSSVIAKESTLNTKASQSSVNSIPTNPLLTNDSRLNNLDASISTRATQSSMDTKPTLVQIEASTVLAKETTVSSRASQSSVNSIPTNPLLTNDARLNNLDASISSRLPTSSYVSPPTSLDIANAVWSATTRSLNVDVTLGSSEINEIAQAVEQAILNESDGSAVISAIVNALSSNGITAENIADNVRTELATELARIDVSVSTRSSQDSVYGLY